MQGGAARGDGVEKDGDGGGAGFVDPNTLPRFLVGRRTRRTL